MFENNTCAITGVFMSYSLHIIMYAQSTHLKIWCVLFYTQLEKGALLTHSGCVLFHEQILANSTCVVLKGAKHTGKGVSFDVFQYNTCAIITVLFFTYYACSKHTFHNFENVLCALNSACVV